MDRKSFENGAEGAEGCLELKETTVEAGVGALLDSLDDGEGNALGADVVDVREEGKVVALRGCCWGRRRR